MCRWGCVGLLLSVLGWPSLLHGAIFETHHMGMIVGEATTRLSIAVTLGGVFEVWPQEIISIAGDRFAFTDGTILQGRIFVRANELFSLDHQRTPEELRQILCCTSSGSGHVTREKAVPEEIDLWSLR